MNYLLINYKITTYRDCESTIDRIYRYKFITDPHDLPEWYLKNKMDTNGYIHYQPTGSPDKEYHTLMDWDKWNDISHSDNWLWKSLVSNIKPLMRKKFIEDILIQ